MEGTRSLLDQLEELVNEVIDLSNRLARTTEDVRFAQSFHPQSVVAELAESRKTMLDLSARVAEVERFLVPDSKTASVPSEQSPPPMGPNDAVTLQPVAEDNAAKIPMASLGRKWEEADARLSGLTRLIERALGAENASSAAQNLDDLALQYHRQKKFDEAEQLYRHALAFREKFFGPDDASVAAGLDNLATLLQEQGRFEEAAALLRQSSSIKEKDGNADHPEQLQSQSSPAALPLKQENVNELELLFDQVLDFVEKKKETTLSEMPETKDRKDSLKEYPEALEEKIAIQESQEDAKAVVNPETEATFGASNPTDEQHANPHGTERIQGSTQGSSERDSAIAKVPDYPMPPLFVAEPVQRKRPAIPAWAWSAVALVALSIYALFAWNDADRPVQVETRNATPANPPSGLTISASSGTLKLPDLLPGTRVIVDGVPHDLAADGGFEAILSEGDHDVELTRAGFAPKSLSVELKAGQSVTIRGKEVTVDSPITGK